MDRVEEIVRQWARERPDVETLDMAVVGRIQRAAQALRPLLDRTHNRSGLAGESFDVLASLRRAGAPFELTPTELYRQLMLSSGAMTNRIDRLEALGLVERRPDPGDRRGTLVRLTRKGKTLIDKALEEHLANERRLLGSLTRGERQRLSSLLRKLLLSWDDRASEGST
jgi:DNA-binding MarR family transcriptional regulator